MMGKRQLLMCAGLVLLGTRGALGDIVHVPINQSFGGGHTPYYDNDGFLWWHGTSTSYDLDINGDGIVDLTFTGYGSASTGVYTGFANYVTAKNGAAVAATYLTGNAPAWWATAISPANTIGPSLNYTPSNTWDIQLYSNSYEWVGGDSAWALAPAAYLAFRFNVDGQPHFGWVRASVTSDFTEIRLYDAGYETEANIPILAGEVPEPGSVGVAAGVGGVMMV